MIVGTGSSADDARGVRVQFFGTARLRAGVNEVRVGAGRLADVLAAVERQCPPLRGQLADLGRVPPAYLISFGGRRFSGDPDEMVGDGQELVILGADAGG